MKLTILLFAGLRVRLGRDRIELDAPPRLRADELLTLVAREHPRLAEMLPTCRVAVDHAIVDVDGVIDSGSEIALIPPVSGGHDGPLVCHLDTAPLALDRAVAAVAHRGAGGIATFIGNVRDQSQGKSIDHLEYEAYAPMALDTMAAIIARIEAAIPGAHVAIHHRVGRLEIGDAAVIIAASAPHRAEAFDACRAAIEALKREVPIWKREFAVDGDTWFGRGP